MASTMGCAGDEVGCVLIGQESGVKGVMRNSREKRSIGGATSAPKTEKAIAAR